MFVLVARPFRCMPLRPVQNTNAAVTFVIGWPSGDFTSPTKVKWVQFGLEAPASISSELGPTRWTTADNSHLCAICRLSVGSSDDAVDFGRGRELDVQVVGFAGAHGCWLILASVIVAVNVDLVIAWQQAQDGDSAGTRFRRGLEIFPIRVDHRL